MGRIITPLLEVGDLGSPPSLSLDMKSLEKLSRLERESRNSKLETESGLEHRSALVENVKPARRILVSRPILFWREVADDVENYCPAKTDGYNTLCMSLS